jgi:hypothetical protein
MKEYFLSTHHPSKYTRYPYVLENITPILPVFAIVVAMDLEKAATKVVLPGAKNKFLCQQ